MVKIQSLSLQQRKERLQKLIVEMESRQIVNRDLLTEYKTQLNTLTFQIREEKEKVRKLNKELFGE